ncbi:crotonase/enoyl-CoA hydratase family protein [Nocardia donostiensis]|uniref:Enoyl-CoA hydratase n=1 Tax=Nocardia donostiensis TaxID=1538463 RepID=A0A1W0BBK2_9NOCA|nr:crotonase/enoyl-CoA hydratase family protein [Nocardia donostiensis]ONM49442.1 enoyl-CoA hydratase [Nocardia donostiensis]OQS13579.1 enoyl-CoA hydratase [Nocardia donostiensis]OQS19919.1 enoyl-CoA hydratase [Nocardia donostiensis]
MTDTLLVERRDAITILTVNRPQARNAIDLATAQALEAAIDAFEEDDTARVLVLTGAGATFSAGMDLIAASRGEMPVTQQRGPLGIAAKPPVKPMISAVEGFALAGGFELALSGDLIVAARDARFGIPEVKRGLVAAGGGVLRLTQRLPRSMAAELALTGGRISADRLYQLGLVNRVTEPGDALGVALELAAEIVAAAPLAVAASKRIIDESPDWPAAEAFAKQGEIALPALISQDAAEGALAFAQKREPQWQGR